MRTPTAETGNPDIQVFPVSMLEDVNLLRPVLESAVRNPITGEVFLEEIEEDLRAVEESRLGLNDRYYAIARTSGGVVVGMMGIKPPAPEMLPYTVTESPAELINAYVHESSRGQGVGRALASHLEEKARNDGNTEIVLNSGPRYRLSGWPAWRKIYGEPVGVLQDYYGPRFHAMVWRSSPLDQQK